MSALPAMGVVTRSHKSPVPLERLEPLHMQIRGDQTPPTRDFFHPHLSTFPVNFDDLLVIMHSLQDRSLASLTNGRAINSLILEIVCHESSLVDGTNVCARTTITRCIKRHLGLVMQKATNKKLVKCIKNYLIFILQRITNPQNNSYVIQLLKHSVPF